MGRRLAPQSLTTLLTRVAVAAVTALFVLNGIAGAAQRHRTAPPLVFSVRAHQGTVSVRQGHSVRLVLRTTLTRGALRSLVFRISGLPEGVRTTLRMRYRHSLILRLRTQFSTPSGRYTVRVLASTAHRRHPWTRNATHRVRSNAVLLVTPDTPSAATTSSGTRPGGTSPGGTSPGGTSPGGTSPGGTSPGGTSANGSQTSAGSVPSHIATWAYDDGCNGGTGASAQLVRQWLTYAESNCGPGLTKSIGDCHASGVTYCTAVQYVDANMIYQTGSLPVAQSAQEDWWLHQPGDTDSAHRLGESGYGGGNILNQANPAVDAWFHDYVAANYDSYDALMMDDTASSLGGEFWGTGYTSSQELTTNAALQAAHEQMANAVTHANGSPFLQIDNGISTNPYLPMPFAMLNHPGSVDGLISEGAPESNGTLVSYYSTMLDEMAYIDHAANDFMVLLSYDPSGSLQSRRVQAASVLLGYSPGHTVSWSDLEQNSSDLAVWPEEGIVPTSPVQSMAEPAGSGCLAGTGVVCSAGGHNQLQVAPGVYRREFSACFNQSVAFGECGVIMNTTSAPITVEQSWLAQTYHHEITMVGGDVQSGGTVNLSGAPFSAGSTTIPADDALLLSQ